MLLQKVKQTIEFRDSMALWEDSPIFLEQETLPSLLSTG